MILYGQQSINQQDIDAVVDVLTSNYLTQGPEVPKFESALSEVTGAQYALAVNSATSALHIACLALGVGVGDRVWTSPITFVASANAALYCGAEIDFVDIDVTTGNMCPIQLAIKLAEAAKQDKLPKVIIPVHLCGHSCDMEAIGALASQYGIKVIEDASHAIGGYYQGESIGNCRYSDICIFSFHPVKIITTAEGGAALTNSSELASSMARLRSHGITKLEVELQCQDQGDWYYEQHDLGFNYRMTELQAALGVSQITRLQSFVCRRNELARCYIELLTRLPLTLIQPLAESISSYHLFIVRLPKGEHRRRIFDEMRALNVQVHVHYIPVHLQPYYQKLGFTRGQFPQAEAFYKDILTLPLHPGLSQKELAYVVDCLEKVI